MLRIMLVGALLFITGTSSAADVHRSTQTLQGITDSICTGEPIAFKIQWHYTERVQEQKKGRFQIRIHINTQKTDLIGLLSGTKYQGPENQNIRIRVEAGQTYTIVHRFRLISQGRPTNYFYSLEERFRVDANGEVTTNLSDPRIECRGADLFDNGPS